MLVGVAAALGVSACDTGDAAHIAGQAANKVESAIVSGAQSVASGATAIGERFGLSPPEPDGESNATRDPVRRQGRASGPPVDVPADSAAPPVDAPTSPPEILEPGPPAFLSGISDAVAPPPPPQPPPQPAPPPAPAPAAAPPRPVDDTVYARDDRDVVPPRLVKAQVSTPIFLGATRSVNEIELVIDAAGRVEEVQLVSGVKRLTDVQLLSSVKTWEFEPATRGGTPVRYRLTVGWESTP